MLSEYVYRYREWEDNMYKAIDKILNTNYSNEYKRLCKKEK